MEANNIKAMREALLRILGIADHLQTRFAIPKFASEEILELKQVAESALAVTPRNCDVGTAEEQAERFQWFCDTRPCDRCTLKNKGSAIHDCAIHWSQMPYEEGVANGK